MRSLTNTVLALLLAFLPTALHAQSAANPAELFGQRQSVLNIGLSPSGNKLVYVAPFGATGEIAYVVNLAGDNVPHQVLTNNDPTGDLSWCKWANDERLICSVYFVRRNLQDVLVGFSRLVILDSDGTNVEMLTHEAGSNALGFLQDGGSIVAWNIDEDPGSILMTRQFVEESSKGTKIYQDKEGLGVDQVELSSLKRKSEERPRDNAAAYIADGTGAVRLLATHDSKNGYLSGDVFYSYRAKGSRDWTQFKAIGDLVPVAVDTEGDRAWAFGDKGGYGAIYSIALDGSEAVNLVASRADVDIDELRRIGRKRRVIGASYATERREIIYFDKSLEGLTNALRKALPGDPLIEVIDSSADEQKLLLIASGDTNPGMVYLFDRKSRQLEEILPIREPLLDVNMGKMVAVSYPAGDGTSIPAYLTLPPGSDGKNLPAIVMPHGGPSSRDEWGFDWLAQYFAQRGYAVLQPNFRGSSGYGEAWYLKNGFKSWRTSIGDVVDAGRWLVSQGVADPSKLAIVGWSYGGYAALQSNVIAPDLFKATVAIAPVTDLNLMKIIARDYTNYRLVNEFVGEGPHISEGSPARNTEKFRSPVLLFHGDVDENVDVSHSRKMADALKDAGKKVRYVELKDLAHGIDSSAARIEMLQDIDAFLHSEMGS